MAKKKRSADYGQPAAVNPDKASMRRYEVEDALRTLQSAAKIIGDKKLMGEVKTMAKEKASEMEAVANQASHLAKMGLISEKQMDKLNK
jgi:hypothetical protein